MAANRLSLLIERITGHPDPNTRVANLLALVLAWNTPFYPLYVVMTVGNGVSGWMPLHLVVLPAFAAVPFVSRVNSLAGRALLVLAGTLNTVVCGWLYGAAAGAQLFLLPCISLAVLLFRARERAVMVPVLACPVAGYFLSGYLGESPLGLAPLQSSHLLGINAVSVGILTGFIAWAFADRVPAAGAL